MRTLTELIQLANKLKVSDNAAPKSGPEPKFKRLQEALLKEQFSSDEEAILGIYGKDYEKKAFQKMKDRLRNALTSQILGKNLSRHFTSNYSNASYNCMGAVFVANILLMKSRRDAAIDMFEIALGYARRYHFTELQLICLKNLRIETLKIGDKDKASTYNTELNEALKMYEAEVKMEANYNKIIAPFVWKSVPEDFKHDIEKILKDANKILEKTDGFNLRLYYYRILIKYHHIKNNNRQVIKVCDEALNYLEENKSIVPDIWFGEFNLEKMENAMLLLDYETGNKCAEECSHYFKGSFNNLMIFKECYFLLCLHTGHYYEAGVFYKDTVTKTFLTKARPSSIEKWKIFRCYLTLVQPQNFKNMRSGTVDFELFTSAQEKTGYHLSLLLAELTHLLLTDQYNKFEIREEAFRMYVHRHIKEKYYPRSFYFCRMIINLFKHSLDRQKVLQSSFKYEQRLKAIKELEHFEVIPYEDLWNLILNKLRENEDVEKGKLRRVG